MAESSESCGIVSSFRSLRGWLEIRVIAALRENDIHGLNRRSLILLFDRKPAARYGESADVSRIEAACGKNAAKAVVLRPMALQNLSFKFMDVSLQEVALPASTTAYHVNPLQRDILNQPDGNACNDKMAIKTDFRIVHRNAMKVQPADPSDRREARRSVDATSLATQSYENRSRNPLHDEVRKHHVLQGSAFADLDFQSRIADIMKDAIADTYTGKIAS